MYYCWGFHRSIYNVR